MGWLDSLGAGAKKAFAAFSVERTRRTVALLPLSFFTLLYVFMALLSEPMWRPAFSGLAGCYLTAFLGLGGEWFWARWFASGLGWWGTMVGAVAIVNLGWHPALALYLGLHGIVVLMLRGEKVAALYDGRKDWRARFGLDDHGAARLGKTVTRLSGSLPMLVLWALGPRVEGAGAELLAPLWAIPRTESAWWLTGHPGRLLLPAAPALVFAVLLAALVGLGLLLRARSAGLLVLLAGAALGLCSALVHGSPAQAAGAGLMMLAVAPFWRPLVRCLRNG